MNWNGIFNPENSFWSFMGKIADVVFLSLFWLLCSLPILTIGASTVALLQFTLKQVDDTEGHALSSFWKAFRANFLQATLLFLVFLGGAAFLILDFYALSRMDFPSAVKVPIFAILASLSFVFAVMMAYAFALLARFKVGVRKAMKDGLAMGFKHLPSTLFILLIYGLFFWVSTKAPCLFWVFLAFSLFICSYPFRRVMDGCQRPDL